MRLDVDILNESMDLIGNRADFVIQRMFERLFQLDPVLEKHFRPEMMPELRINLLQALLVVIRFGNQPIYLTRFLQTLGEKHSRFNLSVRNYESFAQAFLLALEEELGDDWNVECKSAWFDMVELITSLMQTSSTVKSQRVITEHSFAGLPADASIQSSFHSSESEEPKFDNVLPEFSNDVPEIADSSNDVDFESLINQLPLNLLIVDDQLNVLFENDNSRLAWYALKNQFNAAESLRGKSRAEVLLSPNRSDGIPATGQRKTQVGSLTLKLNIAQYEQTDVSNHGWICIWDVVR